MDISIELKYIGNNEFEVVGYTDRTGEGQPLNEGGLFKIGDKVKMEELFDQMKLPGKMNTVTIGGVKFKYLGSSYSCVKHKNKKYNATGDCVISVSAESESKNNNYEGGKRKSKKTRKARKTKKGTRRHK